MHLAHIPTPKEAEGCDPISSSPFLSDFWGGGVEGWALLCNWGSRFLCYFPPPLYRHLTHRAASSIFPSRRFAQYPFPSNRPPWPSPGPTWSLSAVGWARLPSLPTMSAFCTVLSVRRGFVQSHPDGGVMSQDGLPSSPRMFTFCTMGSRGYESQHPPPPEAAGGAPTREDSTPDGVHRLTIDLGTSRLRFETGRLGRQVADPFSIADPLPLSG